MALITYHQTLITFVLFYTIMNKSYQPLHLIIFFTSAFRQFSLHLFIILLCNRIEVQRYDADEERNSRNNTG